MENKEDRGWMQAPVFVMVLGGILMYLADTFLDPNRIPASNKPYTTFEDFFPFYLTEHANLVCRRLHFVGSTLVLLIGLAHPTLFMNGAAVASLGLGLMPFFTHMPHGFIEGGIVLLLFVLLGKYTTRSWWPAIMVLACGYGFAWVGHFYFEMNKPASFVYPTYSLMSDFVMWSKMVLGTIER